MLGCCQSHSQPTLRVAVAGNRCCDVVKDRKNESHSQPCERVGKERRGCCDVVKDRKNESHSQLVTLI